MDRAAALEAAIHWPAPGPRRSRRPREAACRPWLPRSWRPRLRRMEHTVDKANLVMGRAVPYPPGGVQRPWPGRLMRWQSQRMSATPEGASRLSEGEPVAGVDGLVATGQDALGRAAWGPAKAAFEAAVATTDSPEAWEGLSRAAWWQGDQERTMTARESAYRGYRRVGDAYGAARMAMWLASDHLDFRGDEAVASAWLRRGWDLVGDLEPSTEQGNLLVMEADIAQLAHADPTTAERVARQALEVGRAEPDAGVEGVALAMLGSAQIASGRVEEGVSRLEESAALAVSEELSE